jgi:hypothetical protein
MKPPLDQLKTCADIGSLRSRLQTLCAPLGVVAELAVFLVEQAGHRQAMCFWHMQSEKEDAQVMRVWGVGRFGGELVAVVDLEPVEAASRSGLRSAA